MISHKFARITENYCHGYTVTRADGLVVEVLRSYPGQWFVYTSLNGVGGTPHTQGLTQDIPMGIAFVQAKAILNGERDSVNPFDVQESWRKQTAGRKGNQ